MADHRAGLAALILAAAVANLNLAVAYVALPSIGVAFDSLHFTRFPRAGDERALLQQYQAEDSARS